MLAALWAMVFFVALLGFSKTVRPARKQSGLIEKKPPTTKPWIRMSARCQSLIAVTAVFFLGALILFPVAAAFRRWSDDGNGVEALAVVGVFLGTLAVALAHSWMKGDLTWVRDKEEHGNTRERIS